jgi:Uma2 family endonuclease
MAQPHDASLVTPAEYLAFETSSDRKHEYLAGRIFAMAGASPKHNLVCGNIIRALGERLRARRCAVMPSDQHVYVQATGLGTYPDVTVLCGPGQLHKDFPQSLVNPSILVEVLSVSTEAYDRGAKFDHYRRIETLREYVLVSTDRLAVDHYLQEADGTWRLTVSRGLDAQLRLPSVDATVPLSEIYENIDLVAPEGIEEASPYPPEVKVPKRS